MYIFKLTTISRSLYHLVLSLILLQLVKEGRQSSYRVHIEVLLSKQSNICSVVFKLIHMSILINDYHYGTTYLRPQNIKTMKANKYNYAKYDPLN